MSKYYCGEVSFKKFWQIDKTPNNLSLLYIKKIIDYFVTDKNYEYAKFIFLENDSQSNFLSYLTCNQYIYTIEKVNKKNSITDIEIIVQLNKDFISFINNIDCINWSQLSFLPNKSFCFGMCHYGETLYFAGLTEKDYEFLKNTLIELLNEISKDDNSHAHDLFDCNNPYINFDMIIQRQD